MREPGIGRVLVASLHQAISEILPTRLGFYETFLHAEGLRGGTIWVAPLLAVLSFLRQEGENYDRITTRAGEYAAEWTVESMAPLARSIIASAPTWLRTPLVLRVAKQLVKHTCEGSRATSRLRKGTAHVHVRESIFCSVREPVALPLCGFYASAFARLLALFAVPAFSVAVESCRATDHSRVHCTLTLSLAGDLRRPVSEETAA